MSGRPITVSFDVLGAEAGPDLSLRAARMALEADAGLRVLAVGPEDVVGGLRSEGRLEGLVATEAISMSEHPAMAVRSKPDSSLVLAARAVKDGRADAFFTPGNTGAAMAAALLVLGRARGVKRPALGAVIPAGASPFVLLDIGANADCKAEHLLQFAHMGTSYASVALGIDAPTVGLLSVGGEPEKGSALVLEAHQLLLESVPGFKGNVEGRDIATPPVNVIVTDGFTGNVVLKVLEGMSSSLLGEVKGVIMSSFTSRMAGSVLKRGLSGLKDRLDPDKYGAAPLLGVAAPCFIGHGSVGAEGMTTALLVAARAARDGLTERIDSALE